MDNLINQFRESKDSATEEYEFEAQIRGETHLKDGESRLSKLHYNQVIQWLLMAGFTMETTSGTDILRIIQQSVRTELKGIDSIRHYCQTEELIAPKFIQKERLGAYRIEDYWTNLTLSKEVTLPRFEATGQKTYRLMNRVRLVSSKYPFKYDCTIVRTTPTLEGLFTTTPQYEIEVEFVRGSKKDLHEQVQRAITYALRGIQRSNYPIGKKETLSVQSAYKSLTKSSTFIGPRAVSMQESNLSGDDNIYDNFTVTEKTDGERKMLFITNKKVYFIVSNRLEIEYTGLSIEIKHDNMLIDGEHVTIDKHHARINSYFAFDIYYYNGKDVRTLPFISTEDHRLKLLNRAVNELPAKDIVITVKDFKPSTPQSCKELLTKIQEGEFPYETDGLIFTPILYGVGMTKKITSPPPSGSDWYLNLKWKPVKDNTVDFLVHFGDDAYKSGMTAASTYKKVNLLVGFNDKDVLSNTIHSIFEGYEARRPASKQVLFKPGNPSVPDSHVTHLPSQDGKILTEKGEIIEHGKIVEFRYDKSKELDKRWTPLRIRWDKTFPNGFTTAANNWLTIQNPITEEMLYQPTHNAVKSYYADADDDSKGRGAGYRQFHNEVKRILLDEYVKEKSIVIDFAIGRGGDLLKLKKASFILGIDVDEKSITGQHGVCDRYLGLWGWSNDGYKPRGFKTRGLFVQGNSTLNIKSGEGIQQEYHKCVVRSVFGLDPKRPTGKGLGNGIDDHYGRAKRGFNVASIQFAVHYMFKDITTLTHFIQNVAECTAMQGVFVGTCYDGQSVFDLLQDKPVHEIRDSPVRKKKMEDGEVEEDTLICKLTKEYTQRSVTMDASCLGYTIKVLQAEIKNEHEEWLVFFPYFESLMNKYGFEFIKRIPFEEYHRSSNTVMTDGQKELSFLNTTFAFRKVKEVFAPAKLSYIDI
jgi:hypothetical protein